ncbi:MAG: DNA polymerase I [Flavobacteriales bacterium]
MLTKDTDKKLFLLDAYALIFRAYYAFIKNPRINSKGMNTSAIFGFTNVVLDVLKNEKPSHIAVVFDPPTETFRSEQFAEYKANREETPEDIKLSVPFIKEIMAGFGIPVLEVPGFEADDMIGTVAKFAEKAGYTVYMMTSDKDMGQLVSENIFVFKPGRGGNPAEVWGIAEVCERYGLERPEQVIDILGMMGDSVDNIPGIPGIGEKTAIKLVGEFGTVENLLANTDKLKGKQKENVENFREQALLSKQLATIVTDIDHPIDLEDMEMSPLNADQLRAVFNDLEFRTLAARVLGDQPQAAVAKPESEQMSLFGDDSVEPAIRDEGAQENTPQHHTLADWPHSYHLVNDDAAIDALIERLKAAPVYCFDTETSALDVMDADLVGMSFAIAPGEAWYLPAPSDENACAALLERFSGVFGDGNKTLVGQNIKYDYKMLRRYGVALKNRLFDTMIAHYLMDADSGHGMDQLAANYLNYKAISITELIGKKGKNQGSMADLDPADVVDYACEDADVTFRLYERFKAEMDQPHLKSLFYDLELPLLRVLADMEIEGVQLATDTLNDLSVRLGDDLDVLEKRIYELAGETFNLDSPKQLGPILFEKLGIGSNVKKTKTGQYSTGEDELMKYAVDHPIVNEILSYRQLKKLKSTYVDTLPQLVNRRTGRIHTSFSQTVASTGRLSSNNPNLQNIPIRTERGREVRKAFVPRDREHLLLSADYSQVELRVIAALSGDDGMIAAFKAGHDIHAATAAKVFGVALADVDRDMRSKAKAVNFGIIYGQGAFGLAQNLGIRRAEAKEIIDNYYAQFSKLRDYQTANIAFARSHGYVETLLGRRRYLSDINSANAVVRGFAERNAINAPVQGSAADIIKLAMIEIDKELREGRFKSKMILQVHDELVFDAHIDELEALKTLVRDKMQNAYPLVVPLQVDLDTGENWLEAH